MKLTGRVVKLETGNSFKDLQSRVYVKIENGDEAYSDLHRIFRFPNNDRFTLDDEIELSVELKSVKELTRAAS